MADTSVAVPASSAAAPSKQQQFWRARRRRRMERLPQTMAATTGIFLCLAALQTTYGVFDGWSTLRADAPRSPVGLGSWASGRSSNEALAYMPQHLGRELSVASNWSAYECEPAPNSTSVLPFFVKEWSSGAATVFCGIITIYMFLGIAIVCDSFFEASLSAICEAQNLKDDVAGATWMAAGGSAPELMTSLIGVFLSQSDVGFGTIVGSAVFNVLFVIACCAFVAPNLKLTWWPLARDAAYYCYSLALIVIFVTDLEIHVWEATFLLLSYAGYVTIMYFNERLEVWVGGRIEANKAKGNALQEILKKVIENPVFALCLYAIILTNAVIIILEIVQFNELAAAKPCVCGVSVGAATEPMTTLGWINIGFNIFFVIEMLVKFYAYGFFGYWKVPLNAFDGSLVFLILVELILNLSAQAKAAELADPLQDSNDEFGVGVARSLRLLKFVRFVRILRVGRIAGTMVGSTTSVQPTNEPDAEAGAKATPSGITVEKEQEATEPEEEEEDDDDGPFNPFEMWGDFESAGGIFGRTMWFIGLPLSVAMRITIPDCRREGLEKYYLLTFAGCIAWIAILATVMVWMVENIGRSFGIPESIMGLFVLAAGTSIPDCLSSIAVARRGHGDMAVSSSIGSNIFDVLIGLPVPWFLYTAIVRPIAGESFGPQWVQVSSEALAVMILLLFVMVALVITTVHLSGWVLSVKLGGGMMALYFVFMVFSLLLDPITGPVISPPCIPNLHLF